MKTVTPNTRCLSYSAAPTTGVGRPTVVCLTLLALVALSFSMSASPAYAQNNPALEKLKKKPKPRPTRAVERPKSQVIVKVEEKVVYVPVKPEKPKLDPNRPPLEPKPRQEWMNPKDGAILVWIPGGEFVMGSDPADPDAQEPEMPQRKVRVDGFWMYRDLVTVAQYERFAKATKRPMPTAPQFNPNWKFKDHPIVNVSWEDAKAYCEWAGSLLPTEAQWEKAARGGSTFQYPWGNTFDTAKLWSSVQEAQDAGGTAPVTRKSRVSESTFGIRDMAGNVWQWCADWYDPEYYKSAPKVNPTGPVAGNTRVLRGGSWFNYTQNMFRSTYRLRASPQKGEEDRGFRAVMPETILTASGDSEKGATKTASDKSKR
ncbi:MAG: hypothetical protein OHK0029_25320 [Armatimonadaceae bacterium]